MKLAEELLQLGEQEAVVEYLEWCRQFWIELFAKDKIEQWTRIIREGGIPDFL